MATRCADCRLLYLENTNTCERCGNRLTVDTRSEGLLRRQGYQYAETQRNFAERYRRHMETWHNRSQEDSNSEVHPTNSESSASPVTLQMPGRAESSQVPGFDTSTDSFQPSKPVPNSTKPPYRPLSPDRRHSGRLFQGAAGKFVLYIVIVAAALFGVRMLLLSLWENRDTIVAGTIKTFAPIAMIIILVAAIKRIIWPEGRKKQGKG